MDRRKFIKISAYTLSGSNLIIFSTPSHSFFPWIGRFIFGRVLSRSATRSLAKNIKRPIRPKMPITIGVSAISTSFISISPTLHAEAIKYNAEAIWVNEGAKNNISLNLTNQSTEYINPNISYQLRDIETGRIEAEDHCGMMIVHPNDSFSHDFEISDLPYLGAKKLYGYSDSKDFKIEPSGTIIIADADDVEFREN